MKFLSIFNTKGTMPIRVMPEEDGTRIVEITPLKEKNQSVNKGNKNLSKTKKTWLRVVIYLTSVLLVSVLISLILITFANDIFAFVKDDFEVSLSLTENMSLKAVSKELYRAGVINHPWVFRRYAKMRHKDVLNIRDGVYELSPSYNYDKILSVLRSPPKS